MITEDFFSKLKAQVHKKQPFVAYRKPEDTIIQALLQQDAEIYTSEKLEESGFVFAPFDACEKIFLIPAENAEQIHTNFTAEAEKEKVPGNDQFPPIFTNSSAKKAHEVLVQKAIKQIQEGALQKVVLSRKETVSTQLQPLLIFKNLLKTYKNAFVYIWFHPQTGFWLGATPEILLQVKRNTFKTMALAGTQPYQNSMEVTWGEKEREEQQMVSTSIFKKLSKLAHSVEKSEVYTSRAGNLLHLKTDIWGKLDPDKISLKKILQALHPTPAVCGLPGKKAREFILNNETYRREFYSGFLGESNLKIKKSRNSNKKNQENRQFAAIVKASNLYVNLRCMKWEAGKAHLFIGGGITKESSPVAEWEETVNKSQTIKKVLVKLE